MKLGKVDIAIEHNGETSIYSVVLDFTNRTMPVQTSIKSNGKRLYVHEWVNHDGTHTSYQDALVEAFANGFNPTILKSEEEYAY